MNSTSTQTNPSQDLLKGLTIIVVTLGGIAFLTWSLTLLDWESFFRMLDYAM